MTDLTSLVEERQQLRAFLEAQEKAFQDYAKPYREKIEQLDAQLTATMTEQGLKSFKCDHGTAILTTTITPKITDKEKYLDWVLEDWDHRGSMLNIGAPLKEGLTEYMDANGGHLPPNIETSSITRFSIRKA